MFTPGVENFRFQHPIATCMYCTICKLSPFQARRRRGELGPTLSADLPRVRALKQEVFPAPAWYYCPPEREMSARGDASSAADASTRGLLRSGKIVRWRAASDSIPTIRPWRPM